jgi:hypothetical protein
MRARENWLDKREAGGPEDGLRWCVPTWLDKTSSWGRARGNQIDCALLGPRMGGRALDQDPRADSRRAHGERNLDHLTFWLACGAKAKDNWGEGRGRDQVPGGRRAALAQWGCADIGIRVASSKVKGGGDVAGSRLGL